MINTEKFKLTLLITLLSFCNLHAQPTTPQLIDHTSPTSPTSPTSNHLVHHIHNPTGDEHNLYHYRNPFNADNTHLSAIDQCILSPTPDLTDNNQSKNNTTP